MEGTQTKNILQVYVCRTNILFPFVTNQGGFDTGIAISNTSADPFNTATQAGGCTLFAYGDNAPASVPTGTIAAGKKPTDSLPPCFATFEDGYRANAIVDAILVSARAGELQLQGPDGKTGSIRTGPNGGLVLSHPEGTIVLTR